VGEKKKGGASLSSADELMQLDDPPHPHRYTMWQGRAACADGRDGPSLRWARGWMDERVMGPGVSAGDPRRGTGTARNRTRTRRGRAGRGGTTRGARKRRRGRKRQKSDLFPVVKPLPFFAQLTLPTCQIYKLLRPSFDILNHWKRSRHHMQGRNALTSLHISLTNPCPLLPTSEPRPPRTNLSLREIGVEVFVVRVSQLPQMHSSLAC
jgi:hypothetical protein